MDQSTHSAIQMIEVDVEHENRRLDNFIFTKLKNVPKSLLYRLIRIGAIKVNNKKKKQDYRLKEGDTIRIARIELSPEKKPSNPSQAIIDKLNSRILYEDNELLVINKPVGLAVHGGSGVNIGLIEILRYIRPKEHFLELVHRLDKDTSGCLMIAKKHSVLRALHELIRGGKIKKTYYAFTLGHWPKDKNIVKAPLQKNTLQSGARLVRVSDEGKPSLTEFNVLKRFEQADFVEAVLHTGRTHQIRVHAQYNGHPIAGDPRYGDRAFNNLMRKKGLRRMFLHAFKIAFKLPSSEKQMTIEASLDDELKRVLES